MRKTGQKSEVNSLSTKIKKVEKLQDQQEQYSRMTPRRWDCRRERRNNR